MADTVADNVADTVADTAAPRSPDLVDRRFTATRPDELWVTDITYVSTWEGWLYVAFVLDVYSRVIVGWQIASHLRTELVALVPKANAPKHDIPGMRVVAIERIEEALERLRELASI